MTRIFLLMSSKASWVDRQIVPFRRLKFHFCSSSFRGSWFVDRCAVGTNTRRASSDWSSRDNSRRVCRCPAGISSRNLWRVRELSTKSARLYCDLFTSSPWDNSDDFHRAARSFCYHRATGVALTADELSRMKIINPLSAIESNNCYYLSRCPSGYPPHIMLSVILVDP